MSKDVSTKPKQLELTQAQLKSPAWNGEAFKTQRRKAEISQADISDRAKIAQAHISQIENGVVGLTEETGSRLWSAFFDMVLEKGSRKLKEARALGSTAEMEDASGRAAEWIADFFATAGGKVKRYGGKLVADFEKDRPRPGEALLSDMADVTRLKARLAEASVRGKDLLRKVADLPPETSLEHPIVKQLIESYRRDVEEKERELQEKDRRIEQLTGQLKQPAKVAKK